MIEVRFSQQAERDILDANINWRIHHEQNRDALQRELRDALDLVKRHPEAFPRTRTRRYKNARKLVLQESKYLLIYRQETKRRVRVLALLVGRATHTRP
jgi:plasmid stabilization system protein ParE